MHFRSLSLLILALLLGSCNHKTETIIRPRIDLSGEWQYSADSLKSGIREEWFKMDLPETVKLPGTLDENGKGTPNTNRDETMRLSRERMYAGPAWYRRMITIPDSWQGSTVRLKIERTKPATVWVDSVLAGSSNAILTPQVYDLSGMLTPGSHYLTIMVDNGPGSVPPGITGSHAWTEHTQTNWNGIIGDFYIESINPDHIESVKAAPDITSKTINIKAIIFSASSTEKKATLKISARSWNSPRRHNARPLSFHFTLKPGRNAIDLRYRIGHKALLWSEFDPALYRLQLSLLEKSEIDHQALDIGMRKFSARGTQFSINNITTFLRGKHDACVFPLTGHPPMDVENWIKVFRIARSYNINFYRFHSWTPPEAAFEAADITGIYLQPELPFWGSMSRNDETDLNDFLLSAGDKILEEYANHASFVMFALGNELSGDQSIMNSFLDHFRSVDNRMLMAYGSNNYLGYHGNPEGEDYYAGCRIGPDTDTTYSTHIRGSFSFADAWEGGYINGRYPSTDLNYSGAIAKCSVPATGTEVGQYEIYPDFNEIQKYTGVLKPWNFMIFKKRLEDNHLGSQAQDFFKASGALSVICYKADIEMALRTPGFGGFHLLDLQDFPGQGTALVGILDAFMDSKGLITPEEFSHFCNRVVPLFVTGKYCLTNEEKLKGVIEVANYSERSLKNQVVTWSLKDPDNKIISKGSANSILLQGTLTNVADLDVDLSGISKAMMTNLNIKLEGTHYENSYPMWVYPAANKITVPEGIFVSTRLDRETLKKLSEGASVLLFPDHNDIMAQSVGGLFTTDYWNYRMFKSISESQNKPVSPGTMGILTNPAYAIFNDFPTESHSDWQWWTIVKNSRPLILDRTPAEYKPVIQVVDNIERNHKLGLVFEFAVGKGKLLVCMSDLRKITGKPEAKQLYISILHYMDSGKFSPSQIISPDDLKALFTSPPSQKKIEGVRNISYE